MEHFKSFTIFQSKSELSCIICSPWLDSTSFLIRPVTAVVWNQWSYVWFFRKIAHVLRCFTDVDITSTSIKHTVRNFEYQTDPKTSVGTGMVPGFKLAWFSKVLYRLNFQFFKIENFAQTPPIITFYCIFKLQFYCITDFRFEKLEKILKNWKLSWKIIYS